MEPRLPTPVNRWILCGHAKNCRGFDARGAVFEGRVVAGENNTNMAFAWVCQKLVKMSKLWELVKERNRAFSGELTRSAGLVEAKIDTHPIIRSYLWPYQRANARYAKLYSACTAI